jgi:transposase
MAGKSPVTASEEQRAQLLALARSCDWPIHVSKATLAALDARKHWLTVEWLPKYAPELNDIEVVWHDLKAHHLAHKTFTDIAALDRDIHAAVDSLNRERNIDSLVKRRISA